MVKYVVCGNSVEDVQNGVEAMKLAIASSASCGVGGSTMAEVEKNLEAMKQMVGGNAPTPKDCLHPSCDCPCPYCECEDEDEDEADYEEGYMVTTQDGDPLSYDLYDTAEGAMAYALSEGCGLDEIEISYVRAYDDGEIETLERVYPN